MQAIHLFHIEDEQQIFHCHHTWPLRLKGHKILLWFNKVKHRELQEYRIAKERLKS